MSVNYAWEKLYKAVQYLASSNEDIRQRVKTAIAVELDLLTILTAEVPEDILHEIQAIEKETECSISVEKAQEVAERIVKMFLEICKYHYQPIQD